MEEEVLNSVQKHDTEDRRGSEPSRLQRGYILTLAKSVGLKVDVSKIESKERASRAIDSLKLLNRRMNGTAFHDQERNRRAAFGLATKLFFKRYSDQQRDPLKWKQFWKDVQKFYRRYVREQELAVVDSR